MRFFYCLLVWIGVTCYVSYACKEYQPDGSCVDLENEYDGDKNEDEKKKYIESPSKKGETTPHWTYHGEHGPASWHKINPACDAHWNQRQSPIDFVKRRTIIDSDLGKLQLVNFDLVPEGLFEIRNDGHSVVVTLTPDWFHTKAVHLPPGTFSAAQFHFHWGSQKHLGSEHLIQGKQYHAEMHIVHFNLKYGTLAEAAKYPDGLLVLGVWLETTDTVPANQAYNLVLDHFSKVQYEDHKSGMPGFAIGKLLPTNVDRYFKYEGGLTTPGCLGSVTWIVFREPVQLSKDEYVLLIEG
ncbi:carbonic anhydrase 2-like isoform X2 [Tubulanus polymorphus]|uniref:carbonic anhydrase 2-like isoform X2 n=1 Tax=Tubulanus polymorphus TaxID=672921 RepID=UPI003DA48E69